MPTPPEYVPPSREDTVKGQGYGGIWSTTPKEAPVVEEEAPASDEAPAEIIPADPA